MSNEAIGIFSIFALIPFGLIMGLGIIVFEDNIKFSLTNKLRCKIGKHRFKARFSKINRYYCQNCGKPRQHPRLKIVDGGNKIKQDDYRF